MSDYQELLQKHEELQKQFNTIYKANEEKKKDNFKLRAENKILKRDNKELIYLVLTFLKRGRNKWKKRLKQY